MLLPDPNPTPVPAERPQKPDPATLRRTRNAWRVMLRRCRDPKFRDWPRYGGAGIQVCPQWAQSFRQFLADLGPAPSPDHWLGRLDVTGHYAPENCQWTTQPQQVRRRVYCRRVPIDGQMLTAQEVERLPGLPSRNTVLRRLASALPLQNAPAPKLYRASMWLEWNGQTLPLPELARRVGLPPRTLWQRIRRGMPLALALTPGRLSRTRRPLEPLDPPATP